MAGCLREQALPQLQRAGGLPCARGRQCAGHRAPPAGAVAGGRCAEAARLAALLGVQGSLDGLNRLLCQRIRTATLDLHTPGLAEHLWRVTLAKLAVDQPGYESYRRLRDAGPDRPPKDT